MKEAVSHSHCKEGWTGPPGSLGLVHCKDSAEVGFRVPHYPHYFVQLSLKLLKVVLTFLRADLGNLPLASYH